MAWVTKSQEVAPALAEPLCKLLNICLNAGQFPEVWEEAHVIPIHRHFQKIICLNYRPTSLLPYVSKVFEKNVCDFLIKHDLILEKQSALFLVTL